MTRKNEKKIRGIYEKASGSGVWSIRYADANGRIRRETVGSKSAAIKLLHKRKSQVLERKKLPENFRAKTVLFSELADDALEYSKVHKRSYQQDKYRMSPLRNAFGQREAGTLSPQDIERWLSDKADQNEWRPATANRFKALFSLVFRLGMENGKVANNPAKLVRRRRENNARVRFLSNTEEINLRKVIARDCPARLPEFEIALHTGMRSGEQYGLRWEDVDLERRLATIRLSKNGESRHVRLNSVAVGAFQQLFERSKGEGFVFTGIRSDKLLGPRYWFEPAVEEAKVADFTWHCLRHTFASRLAMKGVSLRALQSALGHKTIQMTCRYAHLAPDHELAVVEKLCDTEPVAAIPTVGPTDTRTDTDASSTDTRQANQQVQVPILV